MALRGGNMIVLLKRLEIDEALLVLVMNVCLV